MRSIPVPAIAKTGIHLWVQHWTSATVNLTVSASKFCGVLECSKSVAFVRTFTCLLQSLSSAVTNEVVTIS